ncbi:uncharacterized protein LOC130753046 isoform X2 [Actinidia eriantha]|uniref:uncharacterized protein LOC130753046 isoform X2 n=1 Tax=Actinidia eriantha TaxID=165200 RepID=UPI00258CEC39|nr:uncharacterized protein LOC130753046 isoform X2 [Actinidia eriantha]XP_057462957.1 uncharacterized protein LOC130753046 isoform X2 [Actinidia eriantha]
MENRGISSRGIEVNTMAILDAYFGVSSINTVRSFSRLAFIFKNRFFFAFFYGLPSSAFSAFLFRIGFGDLMKPRSHQRCKMCKVIFQILKDEDSLELIMASYELLTDIDKAWSPFIIGSDSENEDAYQNSGGTLESSGFHLLMQDLAKVATETNIEEIEAKIIAAQAIFHVIF